MMTITCINFNNLTAHLRDIGTVFFFTIFFYIFFFLYKRGGDGLFKRAEIIIVDDISPGFFSDFDSSFV